MSKIVDGTTYNTDTPDEVIAILERSRKTKLRIRIHMGYTDDPQPGESRKAKGRDWHEEYDVTGHVGRSTGQIKVPLMIANSRSTGGDSISDNRIIRIRTTGKNGKDLYRHPDYHTGKVTLHTIDEHANGKHYTASVKIDGETHANFETDAQARKWLDKMGLQLN